MGMLNFMTYLGMYLAFLLLVLASVSKVLDIFENIKNKVSIITFKENRNGETFAVRDNCRSKKPNTITVQHSPGIQGLSHTKN